MRALRIALAAGTIFAGLGAAVPGRSGGQEEALLGYLARDKVVSLAAAADPAFASFSPSPAALASLAALVDPVHVRMFLCASRPDDLKLAAALGRAFEAAGNAALSLEFVGVSGDLSEPKALIADNGVTAAPEVIVYWLGAEVGRMRPQPGVTVEEELAAAILQARTQIAEEMIADNDFFRNVFHSDLPIDCKRCHLSSR